MQLGKVCNAVEKAVSWKDTLADLTIKDRLEGAYLKKNKCCNYFLFFFLLFCCCFVLRALPSTALPRNILF